MFKSKLKISISCILIAVSIVLSGCSSLNDTNGIIYGSENAPIEIVNYTSFECGECRVFHERLDESIKKYIDSGDVKFIEKPLDIKRFKFDEIIYKHMNESQINDFEELSNIYMTQKEWGQLESEEDVKTFLNLSENEVEKNVKDLEKITKEKEELELTEVPTAFINGEKISHDISIEEFEAKIESLLKSK